MKAALSVVKTFSTRLGNNLGSSELAIKKALFESRVFTKEGECRYTKKVSVEGRRVSAIYIQVSLLMDIEEIEREPSEDDEPPEDNLLF
jgi:hypothetical protein